MTRPAEIGSSASSYQILAKLATGGMAEIYLARGASAEGIERHVVLKRIRRERASDSELVRMFLDEARIAAQLQHSNIAQVYDIGRLGSSFFFTMEYVHGETVRAILARSTALRQMIPISCVLTIAAGAAAGLHHAHERIGIDGRPLNIIHRDISPSNLMVSFEGQVKVVDFGIAKASQRAIETQSGVGTVKGKISYLSPEQCRGVPTIDRRSDLFSLGIVLWEMLTLKGLFRRGTDWENMNAIVNQTAPAPSTLRADVPPQLDALVAKLLATDPEARFATGDDVVEAIEAVAAETSSQLSATALGRLVRDLFGRRPEPWIEIQVVEQMPKAVTVTGDTLPFDLDEPSDSLDRELGAVPDLSVTTIASALQTPSVRVAIEGVAPPVSPPVLPPVSTPASPSVPPSVPPPALPAAPSHSPARTIAIVTASLAVGIAIALLVRRFETAAGDHPVATSARTDAAVVATDASTLVEISTDASSSVEIPTDASTVAAIPIDAAAATEPPVRVGSPSKPKRRNAAPAPNPPTPSELQAWLRADRTKDVIAACSKVSAATALTCTEAACKAADSKHAGSWYAIAKKTASANARLTLIDACKRTGIDLCGFDAILCGQ